MIKPKTAAWLCLMLWLAAPALAQPTTIEKVEVEGLFRMSRAAFLHAFGVKAGDEYDPARIRLRFKELWRLGLFEDILVERRDGEAGGSVLVVRVVERPVLTSVTYEENQAVTRTQIEDRLKERGVSLSPGKPVDMGDVFFVESMIRDLLSEKGHLEGEVQAQVTKVTETSRAVHYRITPGGKTRIRRIEFEGNEIFSDKKLRRQLELTEERRWWWPWSSKNLYHPVKWDQDAAHLRDAYLARGYLDVEIRPPVIEVRESERTERGKKKRQRVRKDAAARQGPEEASGEALQDSKKRRGRKTPPTPGSKRAKKWEQKKLKREKEARKREQKASQVKRWVVLSVPVKEGPQYKLGEVSIVGNQVFKEELLRAMVPLVDGEILHSDRLDAGVERITRLYEDRGHLYATVVRRIERREGENVADVEVTIDEDEPYYVARIEFRGNTTTHDRVLRREMLLVEGERFSRTKLDLSQRKVNQLGYFQAQEEPVIEPIEGENRVRVSISGEEQGRNEIQIGGGYSGLDGAFFNGVYSTRNFLGRGQIVSTALQIGGRSDRYQISFQEPWFLNRPYRLGVNVFRRDLDFGSSLRSTSTGAGLLLGRRIGRFSSFDVGYNWESVSQTTQLLTAGGAAGDVTTLSADTEISSLTPFYNFSTINNPYRPTRGKSFGASVQVAGGPLGGEVSYLKPVTQFTAYRRAIGRTYLGVHAEVGQVRQFGDEDQISSGNIEGIPRFQRFWLGGDTIGPRGFETRSITPLRYVVLDELGRISRVLGDPRFLPVEDLVTSGGIPVLAEVGGDRYYLLQTEFALPLNEQVEVAFFFDIGDSLFEDQSWGFTTARASAGIELRMHLPIFPVPLRLIYGVPVRKLEGDRTSNFTFSIGRSF